MQPPIVPQPRRSVLSSEELRKHRSSAQLAAVAAIPQTFQERVNLLRSEHIIDEFEQRKLLRQVQSPAAVEPVTLQPNQSAMLALDRFITCDPRLLEVKEHVKKLAPASQPVLIKGASGTGKELIARALHGNRTGRFVAINCAAISENLIESELFGHTKGSFTGAHADRAGLLLEARMGTAFLDEIGDLPYPMQAKLLRAIQNRVIRRVGSNTDEEIDCRIVAATHVNIESVLDDKPHGFRLDLYYRLSTFIIELLPLAERTREDFELIVKTMQGDDEDVERLWRNKQRMRGNFRDIEQYFIRKRVLGIRCYE